MIRRLAPAAGALALVVALGGCAPEVSAAPPAVTSSRADSADSLEIRARSTWDAYFIASGQLFSGEKSDSLILKPYLSSVEYEAVAWQVEQLQDAGTRLTGEREWRNFRTVETSATQLTALVCVDNRDSRVVDANGKDVTPKERSKEYTLRLGFVTGDTRVLLDSDMSWTKQSAC